MAAIALFMMTSCSDDDSNSTNGNTEDTVLLKKTIEQSSEGTITSIYTYNGTKLTRITSSDGSTSEFVYTNDLLTKAIYLGEDIDQEDNYTYDSQGRLSTYVSLDKDLSWGNKNEYTYNQNGIITVKEYRGNLESQTELDQTSTITFENGNITKYERGNQKFVYTFDTKNAPTKNITGNNAMALSFADGGVNNQLSYTQTYDISTVAESSVFTYVYNANNYPTKSTEVLSYSDEEETITTQYFYE